MIKELLLVLLSLFVSAMNPFFAQNDEKSNMIGNQADYESSSNIVADNAGNTYVGGLQNKKTLIVKQDAFHNTIWTKTLAYTTIANQTSTLTFLDLVGDTLFGCGKINLATQVKGLFYFKMNAQTGALYWSKYENTSFLYLTCIRYANGKFFLIGGDRIFPQVGSYSGKVLAVSSQTGNIIWQTPLLSYHIPYAAGSVINATEFLDATEMVNGKMYITGYASGHLGGNTNWIGVPIVVGITDNGSIFLEKIFDLPYQGTGLINDHKYGAKIRLDMNQDLIIECLTNHPPAAGLVPAGNLIVIKCNQLGNLIFCKYFDVDTAPVLQPYALNETTGSYVLFGTIYSSLGTGSYALKLTKAGTLERCVYISKPNVFLEPPVTHINGNSSFINGKHYFSTTEYTNSVIETDINQLIIDEDLMVMGDCSEMIELGAPVIDVPISISAPTILYTPHSISIQNGGVMDSLPPSIFCQNISLDLVQNSTCQATITANVSGFIDPVFYWSNGTVGSNTIPVNTNDTIFVHVLDTKCCELFDTIVPVIAPSTFAMSLPADTAICLPAGGTFTLTPIVSGVTTPLSYQWYDNSTGPSSTITSTGNYSAVSYWVAVSDSCVTRYDTMLVVIDRTPIISDTADILVCADDFPVILSPTVTPGVHLVWENGSTLLTRLVANPGSYTLSVSNTCGAMNATIAVVQTALPDVQIQPLTDTCVPIGGSIVLSPVLTNTTNILWSNGSTANQLTVSSSGAYTVYGSNACGIDSATVVVTLKSLPVLGNTSNVTVCEDDFPTVLNPTVSPGTTVLWDNGITTTNRMVSGPGTYALLATNNCGTINAAITVFQTNLPDVQLVSLIDTCIQSGTSVVLAPAYSDVTSVLWSDGSSGNQTTVSNSGSYTVYASNACGIDSATCSVTINYFPELFLPAVLDTCFDIGVGFSYTVQGSGGSYQWSSGSQTATEWISQEGMYSCTLTNGCGTITDSMQVRRLSEIDLYFPEDSIRDCQKQLSVSLLHIETNYNLELFDPHGSLVGTHISKSGWYLIHGFNKCNEVWDSMYVDLQNEQFFYLPNSFTPNGDEHNDRFEFKGENITVRDIRIFNRWGEEVFTEAGNFTGWDGKYQGQICPDGIYAVHLVYEDCFGLPTQFKGHVNLLR